MVCDARRAGAVRPAQRGHAPATRGRTSRGSAPRGRPAIHRTSMAEKSDESVYHGVACSSRCLIGMGSAGSRTTTMPVRLRESLSRESGDCAGVTGLFLPIPPETARVSPRDLAPGGRAWTIAECGSVTHRGETFLSSCTLCHGRGHVIRRVTCPRCDGTGNVKSECGACGGTGIDRNALGESSSCSACRGTGSVRKDCDVCGGTGGVPQEQSCPNCSGSGIEP